MNPYIEILRPLNSIMSAVAVLIGGLLVLKWVDLTLLLGMVAVILITGAGNVVNDYVDLDADKINRPKRPISSGRIKKNTALCYCILLFAVGIGLSAFINQAALLIAAVNSIILIFYSTTFQHKLFLGNAAVAYLVGSAFLFGGAVSLGQSTNLNLLILPLLLMLLSSLSNFSREIIKDLEDFEGDKKSFLKRIKNKIKGTLERFGMSSGEIKSKVSERISIGIAVASLAAAIIISPLPYILNILSLSYIIVLVPTDIAFILGIYTITNRRIKNRYHAAQKRIKLAMLLGLAAFIIGILVQI
ncbi:MAG: UbiA family prenyltransferase [Candidatus Aenigmarchaeota archaeon]|nr:UbiA family prenyltransferase [Candidatus Aenigmarchaeota archaeon]